jgi:hypothetical protein
VEFLKQQGFRELRISGLKPQSNFAASTSLFYRTDNVFGF